MDDTGCFLCGNPDVSSSKLAPRRYKQQVDLLYGLIYQELPTSSKKDQGTTASVRHTCATCLQIVREVWDLDKQIESLLEDKEELVRKARDLLLTIKDNQNVKEEEEEVEVEFELDPDLATLPDDHTIFDEEEVDVGFLTTDLQPDCLPLVNRDDIEIDDEEEEDQDYDPIGNDKDSDDSDDTCTFSDKKKSPPLRKKKSTGKTSRKTGNHPKFPFKCDDCRATFATKEWLGIHIKYNLHLQDGDDSKTTMGCPVCDKNLFRIRLPVHIARVHERYRPFSCSLCEKKFFDAKDLRVHFIGFHKDGKVKKKGCDDKDKPNKCDVCEKILCHAASLKRHKESVHGGLQLKKHVCELCSRRFYDKKDCERHKLVHIKRGIVDKDRPKFTMCDACGKKVTTNKLKSHIDRVHKKIRHHPCPHCSRKYYDKKDLMVHMDMHGRKFASKKPNATPISTEAVTMTIPINEGEDV